MDRILANLEFTRPRGLTAMVVRDALLSLLTLSLYRSWARINWRKKIVSSIRILDRPFAFDGTGFGLFVREMPIVGIYILSVYILFYRPEMNLYSAAFIFILTVPGLVEILASIRFRYFVSHVTWSGIRYRSRYRKIEGFGSTVRAAFSSAFNPSRQLARLIGQVEFGGRKLECNVSHRTFAWSGLARFGGILLIFECLNFHAVNAYLNFITGKAPLFDMSAFEIACAAIGWPIFFAATGAGILKQYRDVMEGITLGPIRNKTNIPSFPFVVVRAAGSFAIFAAISLIFSMLPPLADLFGATAVNRVWMFCVAIVLSITVRTIIRDAWIDPWVLEYFYARTRIENAEYMLKLAEQQRPATAIEA